MRQTFYAGDADLSCDGVATLAKNCVHESFDA
jgi:hypothetical protein